MNLTTKEEILNINWALNRIVKNKFQVFAAKSWVNAAAFTGEKKIIYP